MSNGLPRGWAATTLGEIFDFKYGKGLPQEKRNVKGSVRVYGSNGVVGAHDKAVTKGQAIVVGRKGSVGEVHISSEACWPIDTTYFIDEFPCELPPSYWALYLKSLRLGQQEKSSAIPGISREDIYETETSVPPLPEQRRIVAKLEKLLGKVNTCQQRLAKIPLLLKRFRQSVLAAACSGRLTADWREANRLQDDFEEATVNEIAEYVGGFAYKSPTFLERGRHQVIRIGNVRPVSLNLKASPVFIPVDIAQQTRRFRLRPDDIVISMTGTKYKKDYGCAAIVCESDSSLFLNQRVARLRCGDRALPKYLLYWLQTDAYRDFFFAGETGNVNQGNVGADGIRKAPIKLPPLAEQHEIVRRVDRLFTLADQIEARFAKAKARVNQLTQSLLAKAFNGELVPQNPNDEPASVLLERIKTERTKREMEIKGYEAGKGKATKGRIKKKH